MNIDVEEKKSWLKIRNEVNQNYLYDENWEIAIKLFESRLMNKFFNPIQLIINNRTLKGEGFTILTVQCSLIEMFASFRNGKIFNHNKINTSPKYEYKESQKMFISLLRTASVFEDNFWQLNKNNKVVIDSPYSSKDFYKNVRCALMHEARTKQNWHINETKKSNKNGRNFIVTENGKIKVFRTILHYKLLEYLSEYANELRNDTKTSEILRKYFARKLDNLFEIEADLKFDWWTE